MVNSSLPCVKSASSSTRNHGRLPARDPIHPKIYTPVDASSDPAQQLGSMSGKRAYDVERLRPNPGRSSFFNRTPFGKPIYSPCAGLFEHHHGIAFG
jgi:hypothetical protein